MVWKHYDNGLDYTKSNLISGPFWLRFFGDGFIGFVYDPQNSDERFSWRVRDEKLPIKGRYKTGISLEREDAKLQAEKFVNSVMLRRASAG